MPIPILTIVGKSGAGKTTLMERLIAELKSRNYRVGTVKHHSHTGFEIDYPGKDSWRHAQAGSDHVVIASPDKIASIRRLNGELALDEIAACIVDVDIILVEGYKRAGKPTLEVIRGESPQELIGDPDQLFAVVTDIPLDVNLPRFALEDTEGIADFIEKRFLKSVKE
jgi:molybdopterin-guanine dinucleotide biosynthesis protein MobB